MRNSSSLDWLRFMHTPNDYRVSHKYSTYKENFYPFVNGFVDGGDIAIGSPEATKVTNTRSQVLFTVGLRF